MTDALRTTAPALAALLARACPPRRIDLAGAVALPCPLPHAEAWRRYLAEGRHAGLEYLARDPEDRLDPTRRHPWARSLLVVAQRYTDGWPAGDPRPRLGAGAEPAGGLRPGEWLAGVSRYARGLDYHDVLRRDLDGLLADLAAALPGLRARPAVDSGPYLEREWAWLAGLGFLGRNACLIHERLGSGLFLGVALLNLEVEGLPPPGRPASDPLHGVVPRRAPAGRELPARHGVEEVVGPVGVAPASRCGRCRLCLEACPTGALIAPHVMDARRCISTWTIEWRGRVPEAEGDRAGGLLFGCDVCQAVCPWNRKAARTAAARARSGGDPPPRPPRAEYEPLPAHAELALADLAAIDEAEFRRRFRRTPLWRAHAGGLRRDAAALLARLAGAPRGGPPGDR